MFHDHFSESVGMHCRGQVVEGKCQENRRRAKKQKDEEFWGQGTKEGKKIIEEGD